MFYFARWLITSSFFSEGWPGGKYRAPPVKPITKIDLKKGLYGIYPDLKFTIQAIYPS